MDNRNSTALNNNSLNIGIVGLGAIGCLLSSQLPHTTNVIALPSSPNRKRINFLIDEDGQKSQYSIPVWQDQILDVIIICCKATQCLSALDLWRNAIHENSQIVLLQNGMGQHELVASKLPKNTIFAASTTEGAYKKETVNNNNEQHIVHAGQGITQWGYYSAPNDKQANSVRPALRLDISLLKGQHKWHENIEEVLLAKLALNAVINPLTVKYDCHNGELARNPTITQELEDLCDETELIFAAMNTSLDFDLTERVKSVAELTANNLSSMLQDIRAHRETEIDFINGYLLNKAAIINHNLPQHQKLFDSIKAHQPI